MKNSLVLIAGGSGLVPLMSMIRESLKGDTRGIICIISLRTLDRLLYAEEIASIKARYPHIKIVTTLTESAPEDWNGYARRIDKEMFVSEIGLCDKKGTSVYICGPTKFVEVASSLCLEIGFPSEIIKTERFGG
jgi:ferredoxin-NADP reductase